jgi:hypothetical protein
MRVGPRRSLASRLDRLDCRQMSRVFPVKTAAPRSGAKPTLQTGEACMFRRSEAGPR